VIKLKRITLIFTGLGINNINQADVLIYDLNNNLIMNKKTYNGCLKVCLDEKNFYKIKAISCYETINKTFYTNQDIIMFNFPNSLVSNPISNLKTFYLTDYNYPDLKILKGTIILG
jgi:hypothetical protein